jgi:shikimate kinase
VEEMIIVLCGPKHCGKSSQAFLLSQKFGVEFVDTDGLIETKTGKSVREIYKEGVEGFQKAECDALKTAFQIAQNLNNNLIISTGGGIIDNKEAMNILTNNDNVKLIYLHVSAETAFKRIMQNAKNSGSLPPFLDTPNPEITHKNLHERRSALYTQCASITINTEDKTPKEIEELVCKACAMGASFGNFLFLLGFF